MHWVDLAAIARRTVPVLAVLAAQLVLFPMPLGVWVQGLILGLLGSLMAVGLGLIYRLNRIVNFAQGDLGSAPAVLAFGLVALSGVNYFLGLATGLVGVIIVTALVEVLVIRRFARSARLILTVATIGLSQVLIVVSLLIPRIWGTTPIGTASLGFPWHLHVSIPPIIFSADDLVAVVVSVACLVAVWAWLRFTNIGIASRAVGDRRDRAAMLGIPVSRLQTLTWVIAGVLSYFSVFLKAAILGLPLDPTFSLVALAAALGSLALGGFTDLGVIAAAAVAIGLLEQGVAWDQPSQPTLVLAVVALVVLVGIVMRALTVRPVRETGLDQLLASGARDVTPSARRLALWRFGWPGLALLIVAFSLTVPLWADPGTLVKLSTLVVLAIVGCSIVVLVGWAGQVSLGQMSFAALGAVVGALALMQWHWDISLSLLVAGAAGAAGAVVVGLPTLRLDGIFVAVTTLSVGLATSGYLLDRAEFSWIPGGTLGPVTVFGVGIGSQSSIYELCLGVGIIVVLAVYGLRRSRWGRVQRALQANPRAAASYGVASARTKMSAFAVSGFVAGLGGCLLLIVNQQYIETAYAVPVSLAVFTATVVGGLTSPLGAILGAALVEGTALYLPPSWQLLPSGIGVLIVLIAFPGGVAALWYLGRDRVLAAVASRVRPSGPAAAPGEGAGSRPRGGRSAGPGDLSWAAARPAQPAGRPTCRRPEVCGEGTGCGDEGTGGPVSAEGFPSLWEDGGARPGAEGLFGGVAVFPLGILFGLQMMDWTATSAFNVLIPNVRDTFHLSDAGILSVVAAAGAAALLCTLPVAFFADRFSRVRLVAIGAFAGALFCLGIGLAPTAILLTVMLAGLSMGQAFIFPTHNSLIADYFPVSVRPRVYSVHRSAVALGSIFGVLVGAGLASALGWRAPFVIFAGPILVLALIGLRLREPPRGHHEQAALAAATDPSAPPDDLVHPVEPPPSFGEAWRIVWKIARPSPDVLGPSLPGRSDRRVRLPGFLAVPARLSASTSSSGPSSWPPSRSSSSSGSSSGRCSLPGCMRRGPQLVFRHPGRWGGRRLAVCRPVRPGSERCRWPSSPTPASTPLWPSLVPGCWLLCPWPSLPGPAPSGSPSAPSSCCPGSLVIPLVGVIGEPWASATAFLSWCRSF